jgi:tRNA(Arg) A34 adenosine deaminase TadA
LQHQIIAFAVKGGKMLAFGVNKRRYSRNKSVFKCSMHAEIDLLDKLGEKAKGSKIFIYRFNNTTSPTARENKNGKPCLLCQHALKKAEVGKVVYVNDNGENCILRNRDMIGLIGEPSKITNYFLERNGMDHHGKFIVSEFIAI